MTTWVLLRGLIRERRHWGNFPADFQRELGNVDVVTLDLPGNGALYREQSPIRVEDMAQFCRAELTRRGLPPPYHLLALSLGAMVAVSWCAQHPEEIEACVLINTSLRPFNPFYRRLRPQNYPALIGSLFVGLADRERTILQLTSNRRNKQDGVVEDWIAFQREFPVSRRNALRQLSAAMRFRAPRSKPQTPILILGSLQDRLVDCRCSQQLARRWQADSAFHPTAGHDLSLDDGHWIAGTINAWLKVRAREIAGGPVMFGSTRASEVIIATPKLASKE
jgi:pimeloyl-ACP methyl ester carboxylesterase